MKTFGSYEFNFRSGEGAQVWTGRLLAQDPRCQMWAATPDRYNSLLENHSALRIPHDCCHCNSYTFKTVSVH